MRRGCCCFQRSSCASHSPVGSGSAIFQQGRRLRFCIGHNRDIYGNVPGNGSGVNIDVDNGSFSGKVSVLPVMRSLNRVPMEKSKSHLLTARLAAKLPVYADISHIQAVPGGNGALSHDGGNDGNPCQFGKPGHFPAGRAILTPPPTRKRGRAERFRSSSALRS